MGDIKVTQREIRVNLDAPLRKLLLETGRELAADLQKNSPRKTGEYAKGWQPIVEGSQVTVGNVNKPSLTHLLEHGHAVKRRKGGPRVGFARPIPHIEPAYLRARDKYLNKIKSLDAPVEAKKTYNS